MRMWSCGMLGFRGGLLQSPLITLLIVKASLLCTKNFSVSTLPVSKKFLCKKNTPVSKNSLCKILQHPVLFWFGCKIPRSTKNLQDLLILHPDPSRVDDRGGVLAWPLHDLFSGFLAGFLAKKARTSSVVRHVQFDFLPFLCPWQMRHYSRSFFASLHLTKSLQRSTPEIILRKVVLELHSIVLALQFSV